ncbi:response regulator [Ruminococcaceae bacterium OttesenSCG-928-I18]|nr:response regulator [Ruminococcaceae bacterium OttesenSCG-928-I18]
MKKVLVVDDSRFMWEEIIHALADTEFSVCSCCRDAEEAMRAYEEQQPDIVLMDIILPGIDGIEATQKLLARWPEAKVVMVSSLAYDDDIARAKKTGAKSFLFKPFSHEELHKVLQEAG